VASAQGADREDTPGSGVITGNRRGPLARTLGIADTELRNANARFEAMAVAADGGGARAPRGSTTERAPHAFSRAGARGGRVELAGRCANGQWRLARGREQIRGCGLNGRVEAIKEQAAQKTARA